MSFFFQSVSPSLVIKLETQAEGNPSPPGERMGRSVDTSAGLARNTLQALCDVF